MSTPHEREQAQRAIAEQTRELEDAHREVTKIIEQGDTPYGGTMSERLSQQRRKIVRIENTLKGKREILEHKDVSLNDLIAHEEEQLKGLRAERERELDRAPRNPEALAAANNKVREAEEIQDGKRHVRDSLVPRPGQPAQGVELSFYDASGLRVMSLAVPLARVTVGHAALEEHGDTQRPLRLEEAALEPPSGAASNPQD